MSHSASLPDTPDSDVSQLEERFVATLSHEIRTPLNGILGIASLLAETDLSPVQTEYVTAIRDSGARLLDLLNNVLDYARMGEGALDLETTALDPAKIGQEVVELLSPRAHGKALDIGVLCHPNVPETVMGDEGRIRQILFNLLGNAIKFTDEGGVLLEIEASLQPGAASLRFHVRDSGPGIDRAKQANLFEAFRQAETKDAQRDGGVGLGLAISAQLARAMGGEIEVVSAPGHGTTFSLVLPVDIASPDRPSPVLRHGAIGLIGLSPVTTLAAANLVHQAGYRALVADPAATLAEPIVTLADARLPERQLEHLARKSPTLVVLRPEDRTMIPRFRDLGCHGYLIRPFRPETIARQINSARMGTKAFGEDERSALRSEARRILVADDNPVNALLATRSLEKEGHTCIKAMTGSEALEAVRTSSVDLVLMDLRMPVMDGFEATREIRKLSGRFEHLPIVAVSAEVNPEIEARARQAGVDAIVSKPLDADRLRQIVGKWAKPIDRLEA